MQCAPVQLAPVHGFGDGPAPHPSAHKRKCAFRTQHLTHILLNSIESQASEEALAQIGMPIVRATCTTQSLEELASIDAILEQDSPVTVCAPRMPHAYARAPAHMTYLRARAHAK
jgi:hypothetical protein